MESIRSPLLAWLPVSTPETDAVVEIVEEPPDWG